MTKNLFKDPLSRNIGYLSLLVFVMSLQVLVLAVFVYQFIPMKLAPITHGVPPALLKLFQPNRNHFFYHVFVASAIMGQAGMLYWYRTRLKTADLVAELRVLLTVEAILVSWQLFAAFKILQYDNPPWARDLLYAGFAAAFLAAIFWPEVQRVLKRFVEGIEGEIHRPWYHAVDIGIIMVVMSTILIPDIQKAMAQIFIADSNSHFDHWLMAPLWAYHQGLLPAVQFADPLNGGALVLVHALVSLIGGVSEAHVLITLCWLAVFYYIAFYYLLRYWLGTLPAVFGVLLAVKLQMFHTGVSPMIWVYPGQSILRHSVDVLAFLCLLLFARGQGEKFLWLAAVSVGIALVDVVDTGFYLLIAFDAYVALLMAFKDTRLLLCQRPGQWRKALGLFVLPVIVMMILWACCFGAQLPRLLIHDDVASIFSCLRGRNFFAFFASFVPPFIYMGGATAVIIMVFCRQWAAQALFLIPLSVYGLGVYAHFLGHSTINEYYMVPLPLVGCICFWGTVYLNSLKRPRLLKVILCLLMGIGLFTNVLFTYYPNVFSLGVQDWDEQKTYEGANANFKSDAQLIAAATSQQERVALISNFATEILIAADRASFFNSSLTLMTPTDIQALIDQLDQGRPAKVFINKNVFSQTGNSALGGLIEYIKIHYQYQDRQSDHLVLMQRNHE